MRADGRNPVIGTCPVMLAHPHGKYARASLRNQAYRRVSENGPAALPPYIPAKILMGFPKRDEGAGCSRVGKRVGAVTLPQDRRLLVTARHSGKTASGRPMPAPCDAGHAVRSGCPSNRVADLADSYVVRISANGRHPDRQTADRTTVAQDDHGNHAGGKGGRLCQPPTPAGKPCGTGDALLARMTVSTNSTAARSLGLRFMSS